ncbi:MAG TPA: hypothetical protein VJT31_33435 [Rugosimonospora sp.]|nr:hypothetical protein [Rugosimonospora sp.]
MARSRLLIVVASAGLALVTLAGCRLEPGAAAFVGDDRITDAQVDKVVSSVQAYIPAGRLGNFRTQVLTWLVVVKAGQRYADAHSITVKQETPADFVQNSNVPASIAAGVGASDYAKTGAEYESILTALQSAARSTPPTEADKREAYNYVATQAQGQVQPYNQVQQLFSQDTMGTAVGLRDLLRDMVRASHVTISPRYASPTVPVPFTIGTAQTALMVGLDSAPVPPPVVDLAS